MKIYLDIDSYFKQFLNAIITTMGDTEVLMDSRKKLSLPHNCYIILTSKCNLRCLHCYGDYGVSVPQKELTGKEWRKIFKKLTDSGVFYLNISGGEPTCHPDFNEIVESLIKNKLYFMLTTNGICSDNTLSTILKAKDYLLGVNVSLDGPDYVSHGFIRKGLNGKYSEGLFNKTLDSILDKYFLYLKRVLFLINFPFLQQSGYFLSIVKKTFDSQYLKTLA